MTEIKVRSTYVEASKNGYGAALAEARKRLSYRRIVELVCKAIVASGEEEAETQGILENLPEIGQGRRPVRCGSCIRNYHCRVRRSTRLARDAGFRGGNAPAAWLAAMIFVAVVTGCGRSSPPDSEADARSQIAAMLAAGDLAAAERRAKAALLQDPNDPALRLLLGDVYLAERDGAASQAAFERAREAGANEPDVLRGLAKSLMLQARYADALRFLEANGPATTERLLRLRLAARLRVPLARPADLFADARQFLERASGDAAAELESLASESDVIADNAVHVRRAVAYASASCRRSPQDMGLAPDPPDWANVDETGRRVLAVGPNEKLKTPAAAARVARDGDIVEIAAGTYRRDVATWNASGLWLRASRGQAVLDSAGAVAKDMGIWVIRGDNTIVDGIRFAGARSTHKNGSGIRLLAHNLWVRRSEFHDNEDGILSFNRPGGEVVIER
ncbi:MAG TPA: tetratricopeptide repeat protein, partial [Woeseiaceae bacterium]|nr:tetratricopeptide repeat protein [Woeseiaceae bacterium]